jgi:hypothetical protein
MARYFSHYAELRVNLRRDNFPGDLNKKEPFKKYLKKMIKIKQREYTVNPR